MSGLTSKATLVLGGSQGIGAAIVRRFRTDGAPVTFTYASSNESADRLAAETGSTAVQVDSADRQALIGGVKAAGPLDVLVVCAGVVELGDPLSLDPAAIWPAAGSSST